MKLTWKQIETSREIRQWVKGVIFPVVLGGLYLDYRYPNLKHDVAEKFKNFTKKFKKKKEED